MQLRKALSALSIAALASATGIIDAQQPQPPRAAQPGVQVQVQPGAPRTTNQPVQPGQRAGWQSNDQTLATCVSIDNQEEVALAKYAQSKASSDDVKEFTDMLIKDHQAFLQKLDRFAPGASRDNFLTTPRTTSTGTGVQPAGGQAQTQPGQTIQQTAGTQATNAPIDLLQLHREIAAQCLADTQKMLGEKDGDEFDKCFTGLQIAKHAAMQTKLSVLQKHASKELAEILKDGAETTKMHQEQAEKIMEQLADASKADSAKSDASKSNRKARQNNE
jgi:predicted outer membrane protein